MTPQLQQALRLLQLSSLEIQTEIQAALENNPLLELEEQFAFSHDSDQQDNHDEPTVLESGQLEHTDIPDELPIDSEWEDTYESLPINLARQSHDNNDSVGSYNENITGNNLHTHLLWQMQLTPFSSLDEKIAMAVIDAVNDDGYLTASLTDIQQSLDMPCPDLADIEAVIQRIQRFDPVGVAARSVRECLLIQLKQCDEGTTRDRLTALVTDHLDALANHDIAQIKKALGVDDDTFNDLLNSIKQLNPRPGSQINSQTTEYITPDVYTYKVYGQWQLSLNTDNAPPLKIASHYAQLIKRADSSADNIYLKDCLKEARWLLKSLQSRNETLLKVATAIVYHQQNFLEQGDEGIKPLALSDIANKIGMHESTISRATAGKYLHTPRGVYELKHFFSNTVSSNEGGEHSATAIRAIIKKLVADENPTKPLSDSKIATILGEKDIKVARRTVAKYREVMAISPSSQRKRLV